MIDKNYSIKISPGVISGDIFKVNYNGATITGTSYSKECCVLTSKMIEIKVTGSTYAYSAMTEVLSGGTYNTGTTQYDSLLTGLTVPILITENTVDIGYYSVFDGAITQKETMLNVVKEFHKKIMLQIEEIRLPTLDKYLSSKYASTQKKTYTCELCDVFTTNTIKSLSAHKRACLKKQSNIVVDTNI